MFLLRENKREKNDELWLLQSSFIYRLMVYVPIFWFDYYVLIFDLDPSFLHNGCCINLWSHRLHNYYNQVCCHSVIVVCFLLLLLTDKVQVLVMHCWFVSKSCMFHHCILMFCLVGNLIVGPDVTVLILSRCCFFWAWDNFCVWNFSFLNISFFISF